MTATPTQQATPKVIHHDPRARRAGSLPNGGASMPDRSRFAVTLAITWLAWFMFTLDRLVVVTALPVVRTDLDAGVAGFEWTTNASTLAFAMLLLTGAALGDRFGRRRQCAALGTSAVCAHLRGVPTAEWFGLAGSVPRRGHRLPQSPVKALYLCTAWQALGTAAAVLTRSVTVAVVAVVAWAVPIERILGSALAAAPHWLPGLLVLSGRRR